MIKEIYSSKTLLWTILFGVGFLIFEFLVLLKSRIDLEILANHFDQGSYLRLIFVLSISIIAFCLYLAFVYSAFTSDFKYKIIYFFVFSFLILTEYGYYKAFGFFFGSLEIEVALYATNWGIISDSITSHFNYLALIPIIVFGVLLFKTKEIFKRSWIPLIVVIILFSSFFAATAYFTKNTFYVHSFNHGIRALTGFPVIWYAGTFYDSPKNYYYYLPREEVEYNSAEKPQNNIVFIVNESVRSDHLSLNGYDVKTTPTLEKLNNEGFIKNWGTAVSGTTCSVTSNALMLTGLRELPDKDFKIYTIPSIFQYAQAMNYKTYYFDGQLSSFWNGKTSDAADYSEWVKAFDLEKSAGRKSEVDTESARRIKNIVSNSTGNFIWINKYGVHQSHLNSYPNNETKISRKYDEAVRYNLEGFFKEFQNDESLKNTIFIYTSDHGQSLDDQSGKASHCTGEKVQAKVPLFLLSTPENLPQVDTNFKASHSNIFATLLDLMNFPEDKRKYNYAISLLKAKSSDSQPRIYYVGDYNDVEGGKKYAFDK